MSDTSGVDNDTDTGLPIAPEVTPPAAPDAPDPAPGTTEETPADPKEPEKVPARVQKAINRLTRQRGEAERRALRLEGELEALRRAPAQPVQPVSAAPKQSDFANYEEFIAAKAQHEGRQAAREELAKAGEAQARQHQTQTAAANRTAFEKEATQQAKAAGIDFQDAWETLLELPPEEVSEAFAAAVFEAEQKAVLVDYFAKHTEEVARISALSAPAAFREVAKLELQLGSKTARTTRAPAPVRTVGGGVSATNDLYDKRLSMDDYVAKRRQMER